MSLEYSDINFMRSGTVKQQEAFHALKDSRIFEILSDYTPFLAGTIPLDIYIKDSDLDIICQAEDFNSFSKLVQSEFGTCTSYKSYQTEVRGRPSLVIQFFLKGFQFEIFCQNTPIFEQFAVIHFIVEKRILDIHGDKVRNDIRKLKEMGLKTEPAFAKYFNILGDPYLELAKLNNLTDAKIKSIKPKSI